MRVVGMISTYKEGRLVRGAISSLLAVGLDALYVYEGPAGDPDDDLGGDVPDTDLSQLGVIDTIGPKVHLRENRWRTDARKRNEMLQAAKRDFPGETWAVVLDADEVLVNGEYLRDRIEHVTNEDAHLLSEYMAGRRPDLDACPPTARVPLHLVEHDGGMHLITARVFRCDLLRSIDHSSSVVTNERGVREGWGNYAARSAVWIEGWLRAIDEGKMIAWPPLPCEPHIVHRSNLRHPLRRRLRMSAQEADEFAKAQREEAAQQ